MSAYLPVGRNVDFSQSTLEYFRESERGSIRTTRLSEPVLGGSPTGEFRGAENTKDLWRPARAKSTLSEKPGRFICYAARISVRESETEKPLKQLTYSSAGLEFRGFMYTG